MNNKIRYSTYLTGTFAGMMMLVLGCDTEPEMHFPGESWEHYETPEAAGFNGERLNEVQEYSEDLDTEVMMIVHNGKIVDHWGDKTENHRMHSIRKSLLTGLYGIQVGLGNIDMDATMEDLDIDDREGLTDEERQATVRHLLQARSGVYHPALFETEAMAAARPDRHSYGSGENYYYNNWDFNALGTIYEQESGEEIHESFEERIARPIGMQDFTADDGRYVTGDDSRHAAYPFEMTARDLARFGLLYLNEGNWNGEQVLPEGWVAESVEPYSSFHTDPESSSMANNGGYGYMWWVAVDGQHFEGVENVPEGTYTARGAGGHVLAVVPQYDLILVHRVNTHESGNRVEYPEVGKMLMDIIDAMGT